VTEIETKSSIDLQRFYTDELKITNIVEDSESIEIHMKSQKHSHRCVGCGREMHAYHATYARTVQDFPIMQKNVTLKIVAYNYYCSDEHCATTTFAEDYHGFVGRSGRMTERLEEFIRILALKTNCEGAAAICKAMGIRVSGDTIIRMLRKMADVIPPIVSETIGVDDFAYRKGQTYCTVICDEATHAPIEVLDGRDGSALREWLQKNKQVKKVTRDRAGAYAKAISDALPQAMQIADRFHLHQNLLKAVKEALKHELPNQIPIPNDPEAMAAEPDIEPDKKNSGRRNVSSRIAPV
jgi:transposase